VDACARKEVLMRLTPAQIKQATSQFEAQHVSEESKLAPELHKVFGDHSFFLARAGLHIVDVPESTEAGVAAGRVVKLASWTDSHHTTLAPHEPEFTDIVVQLDKAA
jgi:hypothetical protein